MGWALIVEWLWTLEYLIGSLAVGTALVLVGILQYRESKQSSKAIVRAISQTTEGTRLSCQHEGCGLYCKTHNQHFRQLAPNPSTTLVLEIDWVPGEDARGNNRHAHWGGLKRAKQTAEEYGIVVARQLDTKGKDVPLVGDLALHIEVWCPRRIDWDNLAFGYKAFIDVLAHEGLLVDDKQITQPSMRLYQGPAYTRMKSGNWRDSMGIDTAELDNSPIHVYPVDDLIEHETDDGPQCWCAPNTEWPAGPEGAPVVIHDSLIHERPTPEDIADIVEGEIDEFTTPAIQ